MSNLGKTFEALPLEIDQAAKLVEAGRGVRDRAILAMLWRGGLRANELCSLRMEHVRLLEDGTAVIKVNQPKNLSKGAPKRVVAIGKKAADLLRTWLAKRGDEPGPFFRTHAGKRLCTSQIRRTVALAGQRAKLGRRVHPTRCGTLLLTRSTMRALACWRSKRLSVTGASIPRWSTSRTLEPRGWFLSLRTGRNGNETNDPKPTP